MSLAKYLKVQRHKAGLTQSDVARFMGYTTPQFVSFIELGKSIAPLSSLALLAKAYHADYSVVERLHRKEAIQDLDISYAKARSSK
jgi:transcriptional regulator with XRE-family HTH domain